MPSLLLACLAYLSVALPGSTLGLLWPSMRLSFGAPVGALGILLIPGITASVISSVAVGRVRLRTGPLVAASTMLIAFALAAEALAPWLWIMVIGTVLFGLGFGALDTALNAHAAERFGARDVNWMHASYGLGAVTFAAVETGIESGAGIWGYLFLTAGRGLPDETAGVAVAAYWAMMFAGRAVLGPVAGRLGPARVLAAAVAGVPLGAALMAVPGPGLLAVAGLMTLGLAAAPVFPLLTLTTGQRTGTVRMVSLQVAASAVGGAALPAGLGLAIGAVGARILAPALLALGLAMGGLYAFLSRWSGPSCGP